MSYLCSSHFAHDVLRHVGSQTLNSLGQIWAVLASGLGPRGGAGWGDQASADDALDARIDERNRSDHDPVRASRKSLP